MIQYLEENKNPRGILWATVKNPKVLPEPKYENTFHLHTTFQFNVKRDDWEDYIGMVFKGIGKWNTWNDEIQAVKVILPFPLRKISKNENPHITISAKTGVKPVKSNDMLLGDFNKELLDKEIEFEIEFKEF